MTGPPEGAAPRLRFRFEKLGRVRFTSHRDVARMWERALRASGLPVAWSEGFSPRPLLSFGLALPTGCESLAEYLDVRLEAPAAHRPDELGPALSALLPEGVSVTAVAPLEAGSGSLQQLVTSCSWDLEVLGVSGSELAGRVERLLHAPAVTIRRERKGRTVEDDLRPSVLGLAVAAGQPGALRAELATQPRGVRPAELLEGLGAGLRLAWARRTHQWIDHDGQRREPLEAAPVGACTAPGAGPS